MKLFRKKIALLIAAMFILLFGSNATIAINTKADMVNVTFAMPEGHYYLVHQDDSHPDHLTRVSTQTISIEKGHVLTAEDVAPFTEHCGDEYPDCHRYCRVTMQGWDVEPIGFTVTEDVTFTAVMNEDICKVSVQMSQGSYVTQGYINEEYSSFDILVDKGYRITQDDVDRFMKVGCMLNPGATDLYEITGFDKDPLNAEITEDTVFIANAEKLIALYFYIPNEIGEYECITKVGLETTVIEGQPIPQAALPDITEYCDETTAVAYWDITNEQLNAVHPSDPSGFRLNIYGKFIEFGDANCDGKINTADAVKVLRKCADLETLTENEEKAADLMKDGQVNTADAMAILKYCVEQ